MYYKSKHIYTIYMYLCKCICVHGRYLAAKSETDHYMRELKREQDEVVAVPDIGLHFLLCPR